MNYKNILKSWGLKFLGVGLLILILTKTNTGEIFNTVKQFNAFQILWIEVLSLLIILSKSIRFKNILSLYNVTVSLQENILIYGSGMYLSTITPGRFGDFSKIFYLKHYTGCDYKKGLYINILDRLFDLTILLLTSLIGLFWIINPRKLVILFAILIVLISFIILFGKQLVKIILTKMLNIFKSCLNISTNEIEISKILNTKLVIPLLITIIPYTMIYYQMIYISKITGFQINPFLLIGTLAIGNVVSLIPISISGLGTREAVFVTMLSKSGLSATQAISLSLSFFLLNNFGIMVIGFIMFLILKPKIQDA
jgi:hypothetical protein